MKTIRIDALSLLRDREACNDGVIDFLEKFRDGFTINSRASLESAVRQVLNAGYTWSDVFYYATSYSLEDVECDLEEAEYEKAQEKGDEDSEFYGSDIWEELPFKKKMDILWSRFVESN